jgi:L-malate glycosyltransferase
LSQDPKAIDSTMKAKCRDQPHHLLYLYDKFNKLGIQIIELQRRRNFELSRIGELIKIFWRKRPYIIHSYLNSANSYGRIAALFTMIPVIIASERSIYELGKDKKIFGIIIDKILAFITSGIICNTYNTSKNLIQKYSYNNKKVYTVHNGVEIGSYSKVNDYKCNKKSNLIVGTIANHSACKNYNLFLNTTKIIIRDHKLNHVRFLSVGGGLLRNQTIKYSEELKISDKITFYPSTSGIQKFLRMMDVFVLCSNYEGLSNSIMEAMAAGIPCVVTDVGGNSELVIDGKSGYVVPVNDPNVLASKIIHLLNNKSLAKKFGNAGKQIIKKHFRLDQMVQKTEIIYQDLSNCIRR